MEYRVEEVTIAGKTKTGQNYYRTKIRNIENNEEAYINLFKMLNVNDIIRGEIKTINKDGKIYKQFKFEETETKEEKKDNIDKIVEEIKAIKNEIASIKQFLIDIFNLIEKKQDKK